MLAPTTFPAPFTPDANCRLSTVWSTTAPVSRLTVHRTPRSTPLAFLVEPATPSSGAGRGILRAQQNSPAPGGRIRAACCDVSCPLLVTGLRDDLDGTHGLMLALVVVATG